MTIGRPQLRSPELIEQLLAEIRRLGSIPVACRSIGLNRKTLWTWQRTTPSLAAAIHQALAAHLDSKVSHER